MEKTKKDFNCQKHAASHISKGGFGGLSETWNNSLAIERWFFRQLIEQFNADFNRRKQEDKRRRKSVFGGLGKGSYISLLTGRMGFRQLNRFFGEATIRRKQDFTAKLGWQFRWLRQRLGHITSHRKLSFWWFADKFRKIVNHRKDKIGKRL